MEVPHFHQFLLPLIDISKLVNHHARFGSQPIRIAFTFTINVQLFGLNGQAGRCVVVQSEKNVSESVQFNESKASEVVPVVACNEWALTFAHI
jgi:hypothetical protein